MAITPIPGFFQCHIPGHRNAAAQRPSTANQHADFHPRSVHRSDQIRPAECHLLPLQDAQGWDSAFIPTVK